MTGHDPKLRTHLSEAIERGPNRGVGGSVRNVFQELNPEIPYPYPSATAKQAAVLVPVVERPGGPTVVLTQRSADTPTHSRQFAFPGGRFSAGDDGPVDTALRETEEEVGIHRDFVSVIGALDVHEGGMGFAVTPVVGVVREGFTLTPDPREVAGIFEAPLDFLVNADNHGIIEKNVNGYAAKFHAVEFEGRCIWGLTARIIRSFASVYQGSEL